MFRNRRSPWQRDTGATSPPSTLNIRTRTPRATHLPTTLPRQVAWPLLPSFNLSVLGFFFTGHRILIEFTKFYWVSLGFTGFYWVLLGFTGFYWVPGWLVYRIVGSVLRFVLFFGEGVRPWRDNWQKLAWRSTRCLRDGSSFICEAGDWSKTGPPARCPAPPRSISKGRSPARAPKNKKKQPPKKNHPKNPIIPFNFSFQPSLRTPYKKKTQTIHTEYVKPSGSMR